MPKRTSGDRHEMVTSLVKLKINLIKVAIVIAWMMIIGLGAIGYYSKNFNYAMWLLLFFTGIAHTAITVYPWKRILKENDNHPIFFIITIISISIVSLNNYLLHSNRVFPFILLIIFSSVFYEKKKYMILSAVTISGIVSSMLSTELIDVLIVEVIGMMIFAYICYYLISLLKDEMVLNYEKSKELFEKIKQLEKLDKERGELIKQLVRVQEDERKRISRELHDEIGQTLSSLLITLETSYKKVKEDKIKDDLEIAINEFQGAISEIDRIIWSLRPTILDDLGLIPALRSLAKRYSRIGLNVEFKSSEETNISSDAETVLYRFAQEALNNIIKHSKAGFAKMEIGSDNSIIRMVVSDNGVGFNKNINENEDDGLGIKGMRERLSIFGGNLNIITSDKGTTLEASIPITEEDK